MFDVKSVAIIERKPVFLEGLRSIIAKAGFDIAFSARTVSSITEQDFRSEPKLVLASCVGRDVQAHLAEIHAIRQRLPEAKLVVIVDTLTADETQQVWPLVDGFILRTIEAQALPKALEVVLLGERVVPGIVREITPGNGHGRPSNGHAPFELPPLSRRESDVLRSLSSGSSNKVIARDIGLSESTVKVHVKAILRKLKARNRTEAAVWARTHGFTPQCEVDVA